MPTPNNTINLGPTRNLKRRAVQIERGPTLRQQAPQPPRMRLVIKEVDRLPALFVQQGYETVLTIYAEDDGAAWGSTTTWYTRPDGTRWPLVSARLRFDQVIGPLQKLLVGLDFAAARKAREALAS